MQPSVIIAGAGPVGLMLACELRLAGVDVVVYEQRAERSGESRGVGFTARATELFDQRGLLDRFGTVETTRQGHFGGIPLDFGVLPGSHFGARSIPQYRVEQALEERALELGAEVVRGYRVVGLRDGASEVTVRVQGPDGVEERGAAYLVGCDGGRSSVRHLAGFEFVGTDASREMFLADVAGAVIRPRPIGERVPGGMVMCGPLDDEVFRIIICPTEAPPQGPERQVTFAELSDVWQRLTGESLAGATPRWISTFTDATRQVTRYRQGRVLLAGDAAHIHLPAGGQGLSLGVQDAANLGWKLAGVVQGWAPAGLLDTYHEERHPVGARVLRNTRAQGALYLSGPDIVPMRAVMAELMALPEVGQHLSAMVSGFDVRYPVGDGDHPMLGMRVPDAALQTPTGPRTVFSFLRQGRGVLLATSAAAEALRVAQGWADRVEVSEVTGLASLDADAALIRPDGYLAWVGPGDPRGAFQRWFGAERAPSGVAPAARSTAV